MISLRSLFLLVTLLINSQLFFVSVSNPLAIRGAQEAFFAFCMIFTIAIISAKLIKKGSIPADEFFVIFVVGTLVFGSAFFSYAKYGQPFFYGLVESRRSLSFLVYFPLKYCLSRMDGSAEKIMVNILAISVCLWSVAILMKVGVIATPAVEVGGVNELREDRNGLGKYYFVLSYLYAMVKYYRTRAPVWALLALIFLFAIFFITQERQRMLAVSLVSAGYFLYMAYVRKRLKSALWIMLVGVLAGSVMLGVMSHEIERTKVLLADVLSQSVLETSRGVTISRIWEEIQQTYWVPSGALSLLWQDGFHRFYGIQFYLGDVGVFGTFFRLGFLSVPFLVYVFYVIYKSVRSMRPGSIKDLVVLGYFYGLFSIATDGLLEYRGFYLAVLLALSWSESKKHCRLKMSDAKTNCARAS